MQKVGFLSNLSEETLQTARVICASVGLRLGAHRAGESALCLICEFGTERANAEQLIRSVNHPVILLIPPTSGSSLTGILRLPRPRLDQIAGIVIRHPRWEHDLKRALQRIRSSDVSDEVMRSVQERLAGDSGPLRRLTRVMMQQPGRHTTLQGALKAARIPRCEYVRETRRQGFNPPLQFFRAVRVYAAYVKLRRGGTVSEISRRCGYGSADTLRNHFRSVFQLTPTEAAERGLSELIAVRRSG